MVGITDLCGGAVEQLTGKVIGQYSWAMQTALFCPKSFSERLIKRIPSTSVRW